MSSPALRAETEAAIVAVRAGLAVVQARQGADEVRLKGPSDLVTGTDLASQAAIEHVLRAHDASIAFIGEEGAEGSEGEEGEERKEGEHELPERGRYWLVDPLCGTDNFAAELPFYAINIALVEDGQVTIGVVADGVTGEIYVAERGAGARLLGGERLRVDRAATLVSVDPGLPGPGQLWRFGRDVALRVIEEGRRGVRVLSTTLALSYLARGRLAAAVYACEAPPVHVAAGLLIAEEAGAIVTDERGLPWQLLGPIYIACANAEVHEELRRVCQRAVAALTAS